MPMLIQLSLLSAHSTRRLLPGCWQAPYCDPNCTIVGDLLHIGFPWQMLWLLYSDAPGTAMKSANLAVHVPTVADHAIQVEI